MGIVPVIALLALEIGALFGGAVLTETVFAWPGIGQLAITSIGRRDLPLVQGVVAYVALIFSVITVLAEIAVGLAKPGGYGTDEPRICAFVVWLAGVILAGMIIAALLRPSPYALRCHRAEPALSRSAARRVRARWEPLVRDRCSSGATSLSLIIMGARPALFVSWPAAAAIAAVVGVLAGMIVGFRGGRFGDLLLSLTNIQLAFPFFLLAVTIVGILRPSTSPVIAVIALGSWVPFARVTYADTQQLRELEFIEAVRVMRGSKYPHPVSPHPAERAAAERRGALHLRHRHGDRDGKRIEFRGSRRAERNADLGKDAV